MREREPLLTSKPTPFSQVLFVRRNFFFLTGLQLMTITWKDSKNDHLIIYFQREKKKKQINRSILDFLYFVIGWKPHGGLQISIFLFSQNKKNHQQQYNDCKNTNYNDIYHSGL